MATSSERFVTEAKLTTDLATKSATTHTHDRVVAGNYKAVMLSTGAFEVRNVSDAVVMRFLDGGGEAALTFGTVGWGRLTSLPNRVSYDSGKRSDTALLNGWTGAIHIQRFGDDVRMSAEGLVSSAATSGVVYNVPSGFRPTNTQRGLLFALFTSTAQICRYSIAPTGDVTITAYSGLGALYGNMPVGLTQGGLPGTLPGVAI